MTGDDLILPPLYDRHVALGAKFSAFGGWSMPLEYAGVVSEHTCVREAVGLFDVSHLGKLEVTGTGAAAFVNATLSNDLGRIGPGQAQYTLCCTPDGGIVDDLIAYLRDDEHVLLVPNAANAAAVRDLLQAEAPAGVEITDRHTDYAVLAVQGTKSDETLAEVGLPTGHDYMSFDVVTFEGADVIVCRTGYTGERGYELIVPAAAATAVWDRLVAAGAPYGIQPCGLGARDTLRTEMGYPLHGQDIGPSVTPLEARLGWAVGWQKPAFWGREALLAEKEAGPARRLHGLIAVGRGIPRPGMSVSLTADLPLGEITSGTFSPTLRKGIGMALLSTVVADDAQVGVDIRGRREIFQLTRPPFVDTRVRES
ncbi:glycine cleavage system aminomethyltransferase GcvT [Nocardioides limicola]|uniref:glycine cleavage system aminomethyltransferase GcvT n=1 Tax=Nocardioides limicola TaxID=2803368 RepID=UPI00193AE4CA|nr:glycine cleavage system aminomethyltransferase GcvT [Nocardioides sp. DJM-14]